MAKIDELNYDQYYELKQRLLHEQTMEKYGRWATTEELYDANETISDEAVRERYGNTDFPPMFFACDKAAAREMQEALAKIESMQKKHENAKSFKANRGY